MIFGETISRPINPVDMEFYESAIVLRMALLLSGHDEAKWNSLNYRTRARWLDRAAEASCRLFNDTAVVASLPLLAKNLRSRV
jgi:hypothetical protein